MAVLPLPNRSTSEVLGFPVWSVLPFFRRISLLVLFMLVVPSLAERCRVDAVDYDPWFTSSSDIDSIQLNTSLNAFCLRTSNPLRL